MSEALYKFGGLRFWNENEIELRNLFITRMTGVVRRCLHKMNPAFGFSQVEGTILTPGIPSGYEDDVFTTDKFCLRPETTQSTYVAARNYKLPYCWWQVGKSFRRETNDGASASKMRYNEFYQLEFQCIYSNTTKMDYRTKLIEECALEIRRWTGAKVRVVQSDRLPSYSTSTLDIEADTGSTYREMASCSLRNDYKPDMTVCEIAIGLCRVTELAAMLGLR